MCCSQAERLPERGRAGPGHSRASVSTPGTVLASLGLTLEWQLLPSSPPRFVRSACKYWVRPPARPVSGPLGTRLTAVPWRAPRFLGARREPALAQPGAWPQCACVARLGAERAHWAPGSSVRRLCDVPWVVCADAPPNARGCCVHLLGHMVKNLKRRTAPSFLSSPRLLVGGVGGLSCAPSHLGICSPTGEASCSRGQVEKGGPRALMKVRDLWEQDTASPFPSKEYAGQYLEGGFLTAYVAGRLRRPIIALATVETTCG